MRRHLPPHSAVVVHPTQQQCVHPAAQEGLVPGQGARRLHQRQLPVRRLPGLRGCSLPSRRRLPSTLFRGVVERDPGAAGAGADRGVRRRRGEERQRELVFLFGGAGRRLT